MSERMTRMVKGQDSLHRFKTTIDVLKKGKKDCQLAS